MAQHLRQRKHRPSSTEQATMQLWRAKGNRSRTQTRQQLARQREVQSGNQIARSQLWFRIRKYASTACRVSCGPSPAPSTTKGCASPPCVTGPRCIPCLMTPALKVSTKWGVQPDASCMPALASSTPICRACRTAAMDSQRELLVEMSRPTLANFLIWCR